MDQKSSNSQYQCSVQRPAGGGGGGAVAGAGAGAQEVRPGEAAGAGRGRDTHRQERAEGRAAEDRRPPGSHRGRDGLGLRLGPGTVTSKKSFDKFDSHMDIAWFYSALILMF